MNFFLRGPWIAARILVMLVVFSVVAARVEITLAGGFDVFVTSNGPGTKLVIGGYDDDDGTATVPEGQLRVFESEVVGTGTTPYETEAPGDPGFRASTQTLLDNPARTDPAGVYTALAPSTPLTFTFQPLMIGTDSRNLFFWDGDGAVAFAPVVSDVVLGLTLPGGSGWTASIDGSSNGVIAGNTIQVTSSGTAAGSVHTHLYASIARAGGAPDQGFYLFSLELAMTGYISSDPLYFVYGALDPDNLAPQFDDLEAFEEAHEAAVAWVEVNVVPEPSSLLLAGCGVVAAAGVGLRRRWRTVTPRS